MKKRNLLLIGTVLLLVGAAAGFMGYTYVFGKNTLHTQAKDIFIPSKASYDDVVKILQDQKILKNTSSFDKVADLMKYKRANVPSGKYTIPTDLNNKELISLLRSGRQTPVNITLSNGRLLKDIVGSITKNIELDSADLYTYLMNSEAQKTMELGKDESVVSLFIPNTYQVYWDITAPELCARMKKENKRFWNAKNRLEKAKKLEMSPYEVYTLASIVQSESTYGPEQPTIAGLYLNRINRGIPLQADPTVVYATGDFSLRRVLNKHLEIDSPYNTYKHTGLPPGPICMPNIGAIDAVLSPKEHNYIYMCAKPGYNSQHNFARTLAQHNNNAAIYRTWLNKEGIR